MGQEYLDIAIKLGSAWAAGSLVGLERTFHGRPAGFRTHALVCLACALLMVVSTHQWAWLSGAPLETIRTDPTRMAQGIMTGIGFLGAGVIFKEGLTVRGLTTAASIWMTSALGILYGVGFYYPAVLATVLTVGVLSAFRWVEDRMPRQYYAHLSMRFPKDRAPAVSEVRGMLSDHGFSVANMSYGLSDGGALFDYGTVIKTTDNANMERLAQHLKAVEDLSEFDIRPTGD